MCKIQRISHTVSRHKYAIDIVKPNLPVGLKSVVDNKIFLLLKDKTAQQLVDTIWYMTLENMNTSNLKDIQKASGISYKTLQRNKEVVEDIITSTRRYVLQNKTHIVGNQSCLSSLDIELLDGSNAKLPIGKTTLLDIEKIALGLGISMSDQNISIDRYGKDAKQYLFDLTLVALREYKVIDNRSSSVIQSSTAEHFFNFYHKVVSGSGRVYSKDKDRRWFYNRDNNKYLNKLLINDSSYSANSYCMKFKPTELAQKVIQRALELFKHLEFKDNGEYDSTKHILFNKDLLSTVKFTDAVMFLNNSIGYMNGHFIVDLNKQDTATDRVYSVFTSISSETRKQLGYINYDIGAALQTISLKLVEDVDLYPLHLELVNNKHIFRSKVMQATSKSLEWVKKELSKIDNMEKYNTKIEILAEYFEESRCMRAEIIEKMIVQQDRIYDIAFSKASDILSKDWDKLNKKYKFTATGEKKEPSVFFFIWTQYERMIREAMKIPFSNEKTILDVHDAIYCREEVDVSIIEKAVYDSTGFRVKIFH